MIESMLLALIGGLGGLAFAWVGVRALSPVVQERLHHIQGIGIHPVVLLFTLGVTALTGILFGLAPALRATRVDLQSTLKEGGAVERDQRQPVVSTTRSSWRSSRSRWSC